MNATPTACPIARDLPAPPRSVLAHVPVGVRIAAAVVVLVACAVLLKTFGPVLFDVAALRETVTSWGWAGIGVYLSAFAVRDLTRVPGFVMAGVAILAFDGLTGPVLAYVGANISGHCGFLMARFAVGGLLAKCKSSWIAWLMEKVHANPLRTVVCMRAMIGTTATVNAPLAMSGISWRTFAIGTLIGLVPYICVLTAITRWSFG
ncbi:MAG: VTT domain-containing protein [Planctomycetota bacterium]